MQALNRSEKTPSWSPPIATTQCSAAIRAASVLDRAGGVVARQEKRLAVLGRPESRADDCRLRLLGTRGISVAVEDHGDAHPADRLQRGHRAWHGQDLVRARPLPPAPDRAIETVAGQRFVILMADILNHRLVDVENDRQGLASAGQILGGGEGCRCGEHDASLPPTGRGGRHVIAKGAERLDA